MKVALKNNKIHVVTVIDESGSMSVCRKFAVDSLNETVQAHKKESNKDGAEVSFSLISFNQKVTEHFWEKSMNLVQEIKECDYVPDGWTALLDAIGAALSKIKNTINNYDSVILHVITDGQENASREYTAILLKNMIDDLNKSEKFSITFMGCDKDYVDKIAKDGLGVKAGNISYVTPQEYVTGQAFTNHTAGISKFRSSVAQGQSSIQNYYDKNV